MAFSSNPTAAALPQDELSHMSRGQLVQCSNVLHAGWIAANQKVEHGTQEAHLVQKSHKEVVAILEEERDDFALKVKELSLSLAKVSQEKLMADRELAKLKTRENENLDPRVAELENKLLQRDADVIQLERTLRLMAPTEVKVVAAQMEIFERQREQDKVQMQEDAVKIAELSERLRLAKEDLLLSTSADGSVSPSDRYRRRSQHKTKLVLEEKISSEGAKPRGIADIRKEADSVVDTVLGSKDATVQTDTFLVKALDLLEQAGRENDQLHTQIETNAEELKSSHTRVLQLEEELRTARDAGDRKEELIAQLTRNMQRSRSASNMSDVDGSFVSRHDELNHTARAEISALKDKLHRVTRQLEDTEDELQSTHVRFTAAEREVSQLKNSMLALAEENAKLSIQVQTVSEHSPKRLSELMAAADEVNVLRDEVNRNRVELQDAERCRKDLEASSKEIGVLSGRVSRYQAEVAALTTKKDSMAATLQEVTAALTETRRELEEALNAPPSLAARPPLRHNGWDTIVAVELCFEKYLRHAQELLGASHEELLNESNATLFKLWKQSQDAQQALVSNHEVEIAALLQEIHAVTSDREATVQEMAIKEQRSAQVAETLAQLEAAEARSLSRRSEAEGTGSNAGTATEHHEEEQDGDGAVDHINNDLSPQTSRPTQLGLSLAQTEENILVVDVDDKGAAYFAGLRLGNVVCSLDGKPVHNLDEFEALLVERQDATAFTIGVRQTLADELEEEIVVLL